MVRSPVLFWSIVATVGLGAVSAFAAETDAAVRPDVSPLVKENQRLQAQVDAQQKRIEELAADVAAMRAASERHERELKALQETRDTPVTVSAPPRTDVKVRLFGEAGLAFFRTGPAGAFPFSEFRVDDAKLFVEAEVWKNVYLFSELDLLTRESSDEASHLGEFYVDFESVGAPTLGNGLLNVRVGRFNIPFGEEYASRGVLTNPLISHSLSDIWGFDEGVEIYGAAGKFSYVAAVQNGGHSLLHDFNSDKALVAKIGFMPAPWLRLSASAMRTGDLSAKNDVLSEVWIASGFFRALGSGATTQTFHAELYEADARLRWSSGHFAAAIGRADFDDDDTSRSNSRALNYHFVEGLQKVGEKFYGVMRYSQITADRGYPLVGWGKFGTYLFGGLMTEKLDRLSLGFGYQFGAPLVLKFEYSRERGRLTTGVRRDQEDFLGTELGLKF